MKKLILKPPVLDDVIGLLAAWRVWLGGALVGALAAGFIYWIVPSPYRARATVVVDQNVEQVIGEEETDLKKYTYLQRETDKLKDIAWSDQTLERLSGQTGLSIQQLRDQHLHLSQPEDGGWHFLADASDPQTAVQLASGWAAAFVTEVQSRPPGVSHLLEINYTQREDLPVSRTVSPGLFVFCGALIGAALLALSLLFLSNRHNHP
jgi:hypothetical protein